MVHHGRRVAVGGGGEAVDEANGDRVRGGLTGFRPLRRREPVDDPAPEPPAPEDIAARGIAEAEAEDRLPAPFDSEPPPRFDVAAVRLAALGLALVLAIGVALGGLLVGGPPSVAQLRAQAGVDGWTELTVGVKDDQPGVARRDPDSGVWSGFDIEIAYMIAEDLGFRRGEVRFYAMESEDRARMQATDADGRRVPVHLVIASYSVTPAREEIPGVNFSAPYLYTEQSVVTLAGHAPISSLDDMQGQTVCTLSTSTSESAPKQAGATVVRRNRVSECFDELRRKKVDAVSTDAAILAGYKHRYPTEFAHWDLGMDATEAWGVNVGENEALRKLVDLTLYRSLKDPADDRWETAYDEHFATALASNDRTPIAQAQQPDVRRPDVRQLPWESVIP
jgi:glutamate transport system substrate-binding protein